MTHQTAEEVRERHVKAMGDDLGELFYLLKQQLFQLFVQWNEYVDAFGTNEQRIQLLNKVAGGFARSVQDALWADVLLGLTRITDPPKSVGKDNLSVARIPNLLNGDLKESVQQLVKTAADATEFARDWRNRHLAHRDLSHAMDPSALPLEEASRAHVREALEAIVAVMNKVEVAFENSSTFYSEARYSNGVVGLLYTLDDGVRFDEQRNERLKAGEPLPDDYARKNL
jgi:hypothetical protein